MIYYNHKKLNIYLLVLVVTTLVLFGLLSAKTVQAGCCVLEIRLRSNANTLPTSGTCVAGHTAASCAGRGIYDDNCSGTFCRGSIGQAPAYLGDVFEKAGFSITQQQPEVVIGQIVRGLILVIGVIFGLLVIYGGYLWMIARGNEEMVKKAKGILETAVIGIILVVGAYAITTYVVERVIGAAYVPPGSQGAPPR